MFRSLYYVAVFSSLNFVPSYHTQHCLMLACTFCPCCCIPSLRCVTLLLFQQIVVLSFTGSYRTEPSWSMFNVTLHSFYWHPSLHVNIFLNQQVSPSLSFIFSGALLCSWLYHGYASSCGSCTSATYLQTGRSLTMTLPTQSSPFLLMNLLHSRLVIFLRELIMVDPSRVWEERRAGDA